MAATERWHWKDGNTPIGYYVLHNWLAANKTRTRICAHCDSECVDTEFANVSGEYRRDVSDYVEVCKPCHVIF